MNLKLSLALATLLAAAPAAAALPPSPYDPLDPRYWGNVYAAEGMDKVSVTPGITYLKDAKGELKFDLYRPSGSRARALPLVVFINGIGDGPGNKPKDWGIYRDWARIAAAEGMAAITMESDGSRVQDSIKALFAYVEREGPRHGIDPARIGFYAASANVNEAARYAMGPDAARGLRAAIYYYGMAPQGSLRVDLPSLFIVAEGDVGGGMGATYGTLWTRIMEAKAPWTLVFAKGQPHGFDGLSETAEARRLVQQSVAFLKTSLSAPRAAPTAHPEERAIVRSLFANKPAEAVALLRPYVARNPDHPLAIGQLGRLLAQLGNHQEALPLLQRAVQLDSGDPGNFLSLAQIHLAQGRPADAAANFRAAIGKGARNGQILYQLALSETGASRYPEAIEAFEEAMKLGTPKANGYYNIACLHARMNRKEEALAALERAIAEGFRDRATMTGDPDLASIRGEPKYAELLARLG